MEEEPTRIGRVNEFQPFMNYSRGRFAFLLAILILFVVLIGLAQRLSGRDTGDAAVSESALEGDITIKLSYAYDRWILLVPGGSTQAKQMQSLRENQRQSAITWYERAMRENPSPANLRHLLIIQYPSKRSQEINFFARVATRRGIIERRKLDDEIAMWRTVYGTREGLTPDRVEVYASRMRGLELGWYEHLALADLYNRAGMVSRAEEQHAKAVRAASRTIGWLFSMLFVLGMLGLVGLWIIIWYVAGGKVRGSGIHEVTSEQPPNVRSWTAGYLLENFLAYLTLWGATQLAAAAFVIIWMSADRELSPFAMIMITVGAYTLGGILAAAYLVRRLHSAGWTTKIIGLESRNLMTDVVWGIGGYAAALPILIVAGLASHALGRYIPTPPNPVIPLFAEARTLLSRLILFVLVTIVAPFIEETFFRGVLFSSFRHKWGVTTGIILSALVFASVHPLPLGLLPIFVLGSVFAILVYRRGSLLPAMVAHGLNNAVAFTLLLILMGT